MKTTRIKYLLLLLVVSISVHVINAQSTRKLVREGNNQYEDSAFAEAEVQYRKALTENPNYYKGKFNLGDAMYAQENFEESGKIFNELAERQLEPDQKANVYYNLGNNLMSAQKYQEAIEAYKNALRSNPSDYDAKYNLEYARKKLQDQQQQQQNQDQNQDQDQNKDQEQQDQENKDQNKDDQQKDQDQKEEKQDKEQQQNQDQQKNDQSDQQKQQQQQPQQISKEDAQKMLDALKNDEKNTLQELQKQKAKAVKGSKSEIDW